MDIYKEYWNYHLELMQAQILEVEERLTVLGYDTRTLQHRQVLLQRDETEMDEQVFQSAQRENDTRKQKIQLPKLFTNYHDDREIDYLAASPPVIIADSADIDSDEFVQLYVGHPPVPINRYPRYFEGVAHPKLLLAMYYHQNGK